MPASARWPDYYFTITATSAGKLKQNLLLKAIQPTQLKLLCMQGMPGNSDILLEQTFQKYLLFFCSSNFTVWSLEVKMLSDILKQYKDQKNIEESSLVSTTSSN